MFILLKLNLIIQQSEKQNARHLYAGERKKAQKTLESKKTICMQNIVPD
jgi:hypothetical protein